MTSSSITPAVAAYGDLLAALPQQPLFAGQAEGAPAPWQLSPEPYAVSPAVWKTLQQLGPMLHRLNTALDTLYRKAQKTPDWAWIAEVFETGKPPALIQFGAMKRFKRDTPIVLRPDLLVLENGQLALSEIDSVPGGLGFTAALNAAYAALGFSVIQPKGGLPQAFLAALKAQAPGVAEPGIAVVVSDEAADYRPELDWLISQLQPDYSAIGVVHPKALRIDRDHLAWEDDAGALHRIDLVYRFFELFDLPNIPNIELLQFAVKKGWVHCTPPFKPWLEEKLALGMLHHPALQAFWAEELGADGLALMRRITPETWLLDPAPVPPMAAITPALEFGRQVFQQFNQLNTLTQKQRQLVIKPSGFSPLAWGSRGVSIGHDMPQPEWEATLGQALAAYGTTPHILQRFAHSTVESYRVFDAATGDIRERQGRTRLCPYYLVAGDQAPQLAGVLATTVPQDKKIIHGMRDGVMRPVITVL